MQPRVILIEDEDLLREGLEKALRRRGYEVVSASDPSCCPVFMRSEAECSHEKVCGDFLLTDKNMPVMSGLDYVEKHIEKGCQGAVRNVAVMSAFWDDDELTRAHKLGCKTLEKPLDLEEVYTWLDEGKEILNPDRKLIPLTNCQIS